MNMSRYLHASLRTWGLILATAGLAVLSGCATLNEDECRVTDWHALGARDGRQGATLERMDRYRRACASHGIRPDEAAYLAGREAGLREYCDLGNALRVGLDGKDYAGVCPPAVDLDFRRYHAAGQAVYQTRKDLDRIDRQLRDREKRIREEHLPERERSQLREDIRDLDRQRDRLRGELYYLERDLDRLVAGRRGGY